MKFLNRSALIICLTCPTVLALTDVANQRVTRQAPPQSGCVVPPADSTFSPSDGTVYLWFEATESGSDRLTNDWVAPDGTVLNGGSWSPLSGTYCFIGASLGISNTPANRLGPWQARLLNNRVVVFSVPFAIGSSSAGSPTITDANPKTIPIGVDTTITLTGSGFQSGFSAKLWVGNTPSPINPGSQTLFDSSSQVRLVLRVGQPNDPTTAFGIQIINPDGSPSNTFSGLTAMQSSTGGGGDGAPSNGFDTAVGPPYRTEARDGDGWYVFQDFGENNHLGEDWNSETCGTCDLNQPVYAVSNGTVRTSTDGGPSWNGVVIIDHRALPGSSFSLPGGGTASAVASMYAHLDKSRLTDWVKPGDPVSKGQQIGVIGPTPSGSTGPHLHLEMRTDLSIGLGPGYSSSRNGWIDASDFIDLNRMHPTDGGGGTGGGGAYPESAHPYSDNFDNTWTYTLPGGASAISATFDSQTKVEESYDYMWIMDGSGANIAGSPFTGTALAGRTVTVPGNTVKIRLRSDYSVTYYGFRVTNVAAASGGGGGGGGAGGSYQPGDGAGDPTPWRDAFYRNQFNVYSVTPTDNPVTLVGPGCIQYFRATDTQQKSEVLMQRNCAGTVYQIYGGMWNKYTADGRLGGPTGSIGYPTNDRQNGRSSVDGQAFEWQEFQTTGGARTRIVQYNGTAYFVFAGILGYWASQGYENSRLGVPTSEEFDWGSNGCKRQNFQNGWYVWWTPVPGVSCNGN